MNTYTITVYNEIEPNSIILDRSLFTCCMIAMDASDRAMCRTDVMDNHTGEILAIWDCGIMIYDATGED